MHWYGNVPAVLNVTAIVVFIFVPRILGGAPATGLNVTLCPSDWKTKLTLVPTATVSVLGENVSLVVAVMLFGAGAGVLVDVLLVGVLLVGVLYDELPPPPHAAAPSTKPSNAILLERIMDRISIGG